MVFVTLNIFANEQNRGKQRCCSVNFTLGPSNICIYIESIRFWFIIVTNLGWGQGAGGGWQAFCHLLWGPCPWASLREETGDNYGAGTKLLLLSPVTHCFKSEEKKSDKDGHRALLCLSPLRDFQVLMNLSAQHWSILWWLLLEPGTNKSACSTHCTCSDWADKPYSSRIREIHCRWSHDKWLYCPVMEIWIIIECLHSNVCTWYDSPWVLLKDRWALLLPLQCIAYLFSSQVFKTSLSFISQ